MFARLPSHPQQYYRPYTSDTESGTDSDTETDDSSWYSLGPDQHLPPLTENEDGIPNFRSFATQLQLRDAGGIPLRTEKERLDYGHDEYGHNMIYSRYEPPPPGTNDYGSTKFGMNRTTNTTLVTIESRFRDRSVYPQPTFFRMRLPRVYKDITTIQISQMSFLNTLFYFQKANGNTDLTIYENGRISTLNMNPSTTVSTLVKSYIQDGSYNITSLLSNIQKEINYTPPFYDYVGGYNDFVPLFQVSGDLGLNFNEAGDNFYNPATQVWITNPTKDNIISTYWKNRYLGLYNYTTDQTLVAYYYPPLWNCLYDSNSSNNVNLTYGLTGITSTPALLTTEDVSNYILHQFTGITDPIVTNVIKGNTLYLDSYRTLNTFRYANVNQYSVFYDTQNQRVIFSTDGLNTSLSNLLTTQRNKYFSNAFTKYNITSNTYINLTKTNQNYLAILQSMYGFLQSNFLPYFAVPWNQYALNYYANLGWTVFLQNGTNAVGIPSNYQSAAAAGISTFSVDILSQNNSNPTYYWPHLSTLTDTVSSISFLNLQNLSDSNINYNRVYNISKQQINSNQQFINTTSNTIYNEYLTNSANAVCPVESGTYTVFKFKSRVRQTVQVETLPRPTKYRIPLYNKANYNSTIQRYFDLSYVYQDPIYPIQSTFSDYTTSYDNIPSSNLPVLDGWTTTDNSFGQSFANSLALLSCITISPISPQNTFYGTFYTPNYPNSNSDSNYIYEMNLSVLFYTDIFGQTTTSPSQDYNLFIYHDRGGFQADSLFPQEEHPIFIKYSSIVTSNMISTNISFLTYPKEQYYIMLRPQQSLFQGSIYARIVPWFSNPISTIFMTKLLSSINPAVDTIRSNFSTVMLTNWNYAQVYDSNYLRLPIASTLWEPDNPFVYNSTIQIPGVESVPIGYDSNGISTDYTDYIPFDKNSFNNNSFYPAINLAVDPINKYQFNLKQPYNSTTQTYISPGSSNVIYFPSLSNLYTPGTVAKRQTNIVHYYSLNYIAESDLVPFDSNLIGPLSNQQLPYSLSTTQGVMIPGYESYYNSNSNLGLSLGVLGFSILPTEGVWDMNKLMFRSAIYDSNNDPNANIKYMGIYAMDDINDTTTNFLTLSTAIFVLSNSSRVTFTSSTTTTPTSDTLEGFDVKGGTYYEFFKDTSGMFPQNTTGFLLGYAQPKGSMYNQPESIYTAIAFSGSLKPLTIKALSGSAVPYPLYNAAFVSTNYYGTTAPNPNFGVVFPSSLQTSWPWISTPAQYSNYAPTSSDLFSETQSQYQQSIPIATTALNYKSFLSPNTDSNYLNQWPTTHYPTKVIGSIENYILLQDTSIYIYKYDPVNFSRSLSNLTATLSIDQIFPLEENTSLESVTGNNTQFFFLGLSTINTTSSIVRLKSFDPVTNVLSNIQTNSTLTFPLVNMSTIGVVNSFTMNNSNLMIISYISTFYWTTNVSTGIFSQQEISGSYGLIHDMDVRTNLLWYMPLDSNYLGSTLYLNDMTYSFNSIPYTIQPTIDNINPEKNTPPAYTGFAVNMSNEYLLQAGIQMYFISKLPGYESNMYISSNFYSTANQGFLSTLKCPAILSNSLIPTSITVGAYTSVWITVNTTNSVNIIDIPNNRAIWGNISGLGQDQNGAIVNAWQIFYPFQRTVLTLLSNSYNPIPDLSNLAYPEYPHSAMFYYENTSNFQKDTIGKWGVESSSNFKVSDFHLSGYYFNSYIFNLPVTSNLGLEDEYHYLTVRGFSPTETFETLIRFNAPNVYNFGFLTFQNMIDEIFLENTQSVNLFNPNYGTVLSAFDRQFSTIQTYGQGYAPATNSFSGSTIATTGFSSFITLYSTIFYTYQSNVILLSSINGYVNSNMKTYISTNLQYILPPYALTRENYTDPILFQILWKSSLSPQYQPLQDNWGLGYNLGYLKADTKLATYTKATNIYKIVQQELFLRLNPELSMNFIDTTDLENNAITHDSTGDTRNYFAKLLLDTFNNYCTTMIQRPTLFNPPLGRLEQMSFQWIDASGNQVNDTDCDWKAILQIEESVVQANVSSTLPSLPAPVPE